MNQFMTIYRKDYQKKTLERLEPNGILQEFKDPLNESYKNYLELSCDVPPAESPSEKADAFVEKHIKTYPKHGRIHFQTPINDEVVKKNYESDRRTEYQKGYCDLAKDLEYKERIRQKNMFRLPNGWDIPLTSQKYYYRNPLVINSRAMERTPIEKMQNNLDPDMKEREILKITTGESEYEGRIGALGDTIMKNELLGNRILL